MALKRKNDEFRQAVDAAEMPGGRREAAHRLADAVARAVEGVLHTEGDSCGDVSPAPGCVSPPPSPPQTDDESSEVKQVDQEQWLDSLKTTTAGTRLLDHLTHIEAKRSRLQQSSAFEQATAFRRVFMRGLRDLQTSKKAKTKTSAAFAHRLPFGLPDQMPQYLAIVNLSGERLMVYSYNPCLIAFLTMGGDGTAQGAEGVQKLLDYSLTRPNTTCILYYSLPYQSGMESLYWEVRTLHPDASGRNFVDDGLQANIWQMEAVKASPTLEAESSPDEILELQLEAFTKSMKAINLDVSQAKVEGFDISAPCEEQNAKLMRMVNLLKNERKKLQTDHKHEIDSIKLQYEEDVQRSCELLKQSFKKQAVEEGELNERAEQAGAEVRMLRTVVEREKTETQRLKSDHLLEVETLREGQAVLQKKVADGRAETERLAEQLRRRERERDEQLSKQQQAHQKLDDAAERHKQLLKTEAERSNQRAVQAAEEIDRLQVVLDARGALVSQLREQLRAETARVTEAHARMDEHAKNFIESKADSEANEANEAKEAKEASRLTGVVWGLRLRLAIARARGDRLTTMVSDARMAHVLAVDQTTQLQQRVDALAKEAHKAKEAKEAKEAHEAETAETTQTTQTTDVVVTVAPKSVELKDVETMTVPVTSKVELDYGELQLEHAKLHDVKETQRKEIDSLKSELARLRTRALKRPPPPSFLNEPEAPTPPPQALNPLHPSHLSHPPYPSPTPSAPAPAPAISNLASLSNTLASNRMDPVTVALPTDIASGATDPILEHTIRSAALALRTLSDMARLGKSHERSARDAYTRLEILERVQQQPQPQMNVNYQASFSAASYHAPY